MSNWLGVVNRDHVLRGVSLGIAQIGHGRRPGLDRMRPGDWLVYYSPRPSMDSAAHLRAFTAVGTVTDDEVWQADEDGFSPWRRRVDYVAGTVEVPVADLAGTLDLTAGPRWGAPLRWGLVALSDGDLAVIRRAMGA